MVVGDLLSIFLDGLGFLLSQFNKIDIFIEEIYGSHLRDPTSEV